MNGHNPDILTCLANLSADEVFTPPKLASAMLDILPQDLFRRPDTTFLDPVCKSGVFLREIARRLNAGLEDQMPDEQKRIDHILTKQVFGLAITELTGQISRRSVYCSKKADGKYSIVTGFARADGNIRLPKASHRWAEDGRCEFCNIGNRDEYGRSEEISETYAYPFNHGIDPRKVFDMEFDVVVGNPPYQLSGGAGGSSDSSIYHTFVEQAIKLQPNYALFVIPSRWMAGGRGMEEFRAAMLTGRKLTDLVDYPVAREVFPGVEVKGGVCYFLWSKAHDGQTNVTTIRGEDRVGPISRKLDEFDVLVRDERAVGILRKVRSAGEPSITDILTADTPFGIATNFTEYHEKQKSGDVALHYVRSGKRGTGFLSRKEITKNPTLIDKWKVLVPKAGSDGGQKIPDAVLGKPWTVAPPSAATQSFLAFCVTSESEARSVESYYRTKFFRHLVSLRKLTQDALRPMYIWVPIQTWDRTWTDKALYKKYRLTDEEINYIEAVIRPLGEAE